VDVIDTPNKKVNKNNDAKASTIAGSSVANTPSTNKTPGSAQAQNDRNQLARE